MTSPIPADRWAAGEPYERFMGRWSRPLARAFVAWLDMPPGRHWLDVGCGTGALTEAILAQAAPAKVVGVDPSPGFIEYARHAITDPRAEFLLGDALRLPALVPAPDAAVAGLVLNFIPDPLAALRVFHATVRPNAVVAGYVWDYGAGMEMLRYFWDSAGALDPEARALDQGARFPLCRPEALAEAFAQAGLRDIEVRGLETGMAFASFEDYWLPFLGGQGAAPTYIARVSASAREALAAHLRVALPIQADGSFTLGARAWAVRGRRPA